MPDFRYKIRDKYGKPSTGTVNAESKESVASNFKKMGYALVLIEEEKNKALSRSFNPIVRFFHRVSLEELIVFTQQLMTLQRSGVPILVSLESIRDQSNNAYFRKVITEIYQDIESGKGFSESLSKFPDIFSDIYVNMVRSGEAAGILDEVLERLSSLIEHEQDLRMQIKQATRYPLLVITAICLAFPVAVLFIIPKFSSLFARFNTELPLPTRMLLGLNFVLVHYWGVVLAGIIALVIAVRYFINTVQGRHLWDRVKLKLPIFGNLFLKISMARFSRLTALLSASGIPIINTLEVLKPAVGNKVIAASIEGIIKGISEGKGIAESMKLSGLFPGILIQMVKIGEETGKIDELLLRVADYYDLQISYTVKNLTVLIEPILIFMLGIMVLTLALGIFMPMWDLISLFRH